MPLLWQNAKSVYRLVFLYRDPAALVGYAQKFQNVGTQVGARKVALEALYNG